jgi:hypothetical protein
VHEGCGHRRAVQGRPAVSRESPPCYALFLLFFLMLCSVKICEIYKLNICVEIACCGNWFLWWDENVVKRWDVMWILCCYSYDFVMYMRWDDEYEMRWDEWDEGLGFRV